MAISDKKRLQVANICYASVSSQFAMFINAKNRGAKFTWTNWIDSCEESAEDWMVIHRVRGDKQTIIDTAKQYSREIAEGLVKKAGLV